MSNKTIENLLKERDITQEEFDILFKSEKNHSDLDFFEKALKKVIQLQNKQKEYNLSYIDFLNFNHDNYQFNSKKINFSYATFLNKVYFNHIVFEKGINFWHTTFKEDVHFYDNEIKGESKFENAIFEMDAKFNRNIFIRGANFNRTLFKGNCTFIENKFLCDTFFESVIFEKDCDLSRCSFEDRISLKNTNIKELFEFSDTRFSKLNVVGIRFDKANFLNIKGIKNKQETVISFHFFENKESARIIKSHVEKENNIIDSNRFFSIEQELYTNELKKSNEPDRWQNLFVLWLNKYVSYFGTDWVRPIFVMMIFTFLFTGIYSILQDGDEGINFLNSQWYLLIGFGYSILLYIFYHQKLWKTLIFSIMVYLLAIYLDQDIKELINNSAKLVNPLNIFKEDKNYFEDMVLYGMFIKLTISTFFYQFVISFRQNTRRKL